VAGAEAFIDRMEAAKAEAAANEQPAPSFPNVCVKGKISAIAYEFSTYAGTATFWMSDDGKAYGVSDDKKSTTEPAKDFECYGIYWYNNTQWTEGKGNIAVGDEVVVKGQLTYYASKGIYETNNKQAWLYSLNGVTE
jgi:exonuclease VII large subunit